MRSRRHPIPPSTRFGNLTTTGVYFSGTPRPHKRPGRYECICDCGAIITISYSGLHARSPVCKCRKMLTKPAERIPPGTRFGKLVTTGRYFPSHTQPPRRQPSWECRCDCGNVLLVQTALLTRDPPQQACYKCANIGHTKADRVRTLIPEYHPWATMVQRCTNPKDPAYQYYGGRGIQIHPSWRSFDQFYADMAPRPSPKHSLDRYPDKNGNYEPGNVRWATMKEQGFNRRSNRRVTFNGIERCVTEWAEEVGIKRGTLYGRLNAGMSAEEALTTPINKSKSRQRISESGATSIHVSISSPKCAAKTTP